MLDVTVVHSGEGQKTLRKVPQIAFPTLSTST